jgi:NAD(P)-dependent dehydrogenase (short-subunit alcohol dehydrogenase family)
MTAKDLFSLAGKAALVTGASSGFGRHFARVLAGAGAKVARAARRLDVLEQLASEIRAHGGEAAALTMDVTDRASVAKAVAGAEAALGPITILVNNAGVPSGAFFTKTSEEEWRSVMSVNLDGVFRVGQETARRMAANRTGGSIINIASLAATYGMPFALHYTTSKAAVIGLTRGLARELGRDNIRVNALAPSAVMTEGTAEFFGERLDRGLEVIRAGQSIQRTLEPADLTGTVAWLISDGSRFVTGQTIAVDGGTVML